VGEVIAAIVVTAGIVFGLGASGVGIAWLNDKRQAALMRQQPTLTPREILEHRFARGEIDEAEFNRRLNRLLIGPTLEID
jgi:uncharacterized membrane protein